MAVYIERMKGLSPLERLKGGYSYVEDKEGRNIRSAEQVLEGQDILIRVSDGRIEAKVTGATREVNGMGTERQMRNKLPETEQAALKCREFGDYKQEDRE